MISGWISEEELELAKGSCAVKREMTGDQLYDLEPDLTGPQSKFILTLMRKIKIKTLSELNTDWIRTKTNGRLGK